MESICVVLCIIMPILIVRHGLSEVNNKESAAFGQPYAQLMAPGIEQAAAVGIALATEHGIDCEQTAAAASDMYRSQQTAAIAGFTAVRNYTILNEVDVPKTPELRAVLDSHQFVPEALAAAEKVLSSPPEEKIWFSHGYLIAALCELTGADTTGQRFIPRFGEIRELPIY
jgi:phosphohistidine phosphatase SixA